MTSPEPVLTPEIFDLARAVADRYAGTLADVLRLAIPPRHAAAEREAPRGGGPRKSGPEAAGREPGSWGRYPAGAAFLAGLAEGRPVRAAWSALPGPEWPAEIAIAAATTAAAGRGVVIVVPDARDLSRVDTALTDVARGQQAQWDHVCLSADLGPAERYRRWLAVRRGLVQVVAGTRAAMFAPVAELGLVVLWDDGDDLHAEPRAPYPNVREVLALRAHRTGAAALIGGFARTAELTQLVASGWARPLTGRPEALRQAAPKVRAAPDEAELARDAAAMTARLPSLALRTARMALRAGPAPRQAPARQGGAPAPRRRTCPGPGAQARLPGRRRLRPMPRAGQVRHLRRAAGDRRLARDAWLPVVRGAGGGLDLRPLRGRPATRARHRRGAHRGGTGPGLPRRAGAHPGRPARARRRTRRTRAGHRYPGAEPVAEEGYAAAL